MIHKNKEQMGFSDVYVEKRVRKNIFFKQINMLIDWRALEKGDYETVGKKMYETHRCMSNLYEVSCEELDFLNDVAKACHVTGSRVMGGGFGGCTINLVKDELYDAFIRTAKKTYLNKYGYEPKAYDVVISDGTRRL
jgi:galactokinase